jgi:hypothetical protein
MVRQNNQNGQVIPEADLESLKLGVANAIGLGSQVGVSSVTAANYTEVIELHKDQISSELGVLPQVERVGWENITSRDCGRIGGRIGGHLGGQMVREMIQRAETILAARQ